MKIREEAPAEFAAIRTLIETAFRTAKVSDGDEQNFTARLREGKGYLPSLALVAEERDTIVGHIMLTRLADERAAGIGEGLLLAAPLCVASAFRSQGVGSALMREALRRATQSGYKAVVLVGDPAYYSRFGFRESTRFGIRNTDGIPDRYVLMLELEPHVLKACRGTLTFAGL